MILRDVMVWSGIITSERVNRLRPVEQLFFHKLLHVCDGAGRFENDADLLRSTLYGRCLERVSRRHVSQWLEAVRAAELVRLYTVDGRGYGRVLNYRQRDKNRPVRYPPEAEAQKELPGLETAAQDPPRQVHEAPTVGAAVNGREEKEREDARPRRAPPTTQRLFPGELQKLIESAREELYELKHPGGCPLPQNLTGEKAKRAQQLVDRIAKWKQRLEEVAA